MANRNLTFDELKTGAKFFVGSLLAEAVIFAPKREVKIGGAKLTLQGLFPLTQNLLAGGSQKVLDTVVPGAADKLTDLLLKTQLEPFVRDKILWFLYDYLEQFTLSKVMGKLFDRSSLLERNKFSTALRDYLSGVLSNQDDRKDFVDSLTKGIMDSMGVMTDGTILSLVLNDKLLDVVKDTVEAVVDHFMSSQTGDQIVEQLLKNVQNMDQYTVPYFLEEKMGIPRAKMAAMIDALYDRYLGKTMAQNVRSKNLGSQVAFNLSNLNYERFYDELIHNHLDDLLRVAVLAASAGIFMMNKTDSVSTRLKKAKEFRGRVSGLGRTGSTKKEARKAVRKLLTDHHED